MLDHVHVNGARGICWQTPLYNKKVNFDPGYGSRSKEVRSS
jgi:hypothetical protein